MSLRAKTGRRRGYDGRLRKYATRFWNNLRVFL